MENQDWKSDGRFDEFLIISDPSSTEDQLREVVRNTKFSQHRMMIGLREDCPDELFVEIFASLGMGNGQLELMAKEMSEELFYRVISAVQNPPLTLNNLLMFKSLPEAIVRDIASLKQMHFALAKSQQTIPQDLIDEIIATGSHNALATLLSHKSTTNKQRLRILRKVEFVPAKRMAIPFIREFITTPGLSESVLHEFCKLKRDNELYACVTETRECDSLANQEPGSYVIPDSLKSFLAVESENTLIALWNSSWSIPVKTEKQAIMRSNRRTGMIIARKLRNPELMTLLLQHPELDVRLEALRKLDPQYSTEHALIISTDQDSRVRMFAANGIGVPKTLLRNLAMDNNDNVAFSAIESYQRNVSRDIFSRNNQ